jgi:hypothetical protein
MPGKAINTVWKVEHNTGSVAILVAREGRREVLRPVIMNRHTFLTSLAPGRFVDEAKLRIKFDVLRELRVGR